jgi:hypothetical protein
LTLCHARGEVPGTVRRGFGNLAWSRSSRALLSVLALPQGTAEPFSATFTLTQNGSTFPTDQSDSGGNYLTALDGTPLTATYAVSLNQSSAALIVGSYNNASVTTDGTIYGAGVPNAGAISWLLTNLGPGATTPIQQEALRAAIWHEEYTSGFAFNGQYDFQLDGADNSLGNGNDPALIQAYQADLAALGNQTAPVGSVLWISPGDSARTGLKHVQGLVATTSSTPGSPGPTPTQTPTATPPQVVDIVVSAHSKKAGSAFTVTFNEPLDPGWRTIPACTTSSRA